MQTDGWMMDEWLDRWKVILVDGWTLVLRDS